MASKASKLRIVKCPKCLRLLTEFSDVPVYTCGGCGQVLKAKNGQANNGNSASQMLGSISSEKDPSQHVSDGGGSVNGISTLLNGQAALFSTDSNNSTDIDHVGERKHVAVPSEKVSCSDSENNYHKEEESSGCTENSSMESGITDDSLSCTRQPETLRDRTIFVASDRQERNIIQVNVDSSFPNEQLDDSWKFSELGSVDSSSGCQINATENSPASEEDIGDADPRNISCEKMNVPTASSSPAYDGSDSSYDSVSDSHEQFLALPSAVGNKEVSDSNNTNESDGKEDVLPEDGKDSKPHVQSGNLSLNSPVSERCGASLAVFGSSDSSNHGYCRENSRHSEVFHSARKELQDDLLSMSPSRDSSFRNLSQNSRSDGPSRLRNLQKDRMELLRKVDELRDHLTRPFVQGREGNRGFHILGARQGGHWPSLHNRGSDKVLQYCCNSNVTQTHSRSFGQGATAQPYQSLRVPVSGQGNSSCLHHHPRDWCIPVQLPPDICCKACTPHVFCCPSTVSGPRCCKNCDIALCSHKSRTRDQHFEKLYCKEKRQPLKRHCRPVSGGAPFVICNHCVRLLQLPVDFLVSRARLHKLKCGGCSQVLVFLSHGGGRIVPHDGSQLEDPAPSEADNAVEHGARPELSADRCCAGPQGDPVSYCEEYGPPFSSYGYSTDGEPAPHIPSSLQRYYRRHGKQAVGSPLHRLMGYDSATELIYQPSDEDEAYESRDLARSHRTSDEIRSSEADSGTGVGHHHPLEGQSQIVCRPEHTQAPTEDGSVMRSTNPRGGSSPLRGFFKKGIKELNHGLESMKPKRHTGGRVIPAP